MLFRAALLYGALCSVTSAPAQVPAPTPGLAPSYSYSPTPLGIDVPHIALLLPVDSSTFHRHAEALRDGFLAASKIPDPPTMLIRIYPVGEDPNLAVASYKQALRTGARLVVGPLTRVAVTAVAAGDISAPTLLLNAPEGALPDRPNLYVISLQIEAEARQAARLAYQEGRRRALTVVGDSQILKRLHRAFVGEFVNLGGEHAGEFLYNTSPAELERLQQAVESRVADMVFLALDAQQARGVQAALGTLAIYASSQAYSGDIRSGAVAGLAGTRILDLPWLLQRQHPAVMIYPRQSYPGDPDLERLYALGIDAWRVGQALLARQTEITLDGVTGNLTLGPDRQFTRELVSVRLGEDLPAAPVGPIPQFDTPSAAGPPLTLRPAAKPAATATP